MTSHIKPSIHLSKHQKNMAENRLSSKILTSNVTQTYKHSIQTTNKHIRYVHHPKCMFM